MNKIVGLVIVIVIFSVAASLYGEGPELDLADIPQNPGMPPDEYIRHVLQEGTVLCPVGAYSDAVDYVVEIDENHLCGINRSRLKIFSKDDIENVTASYWLPHYSLRVFEFYKGYIYLPYRRNGVMVFDVRDPHHIRLAAQLDVSSSRYIAVSDDKLFAFSSGDKDLVIFSLENPEEPRELVRWVIDEDLREGRRVKVYGSRAFVACRAGLAVLDVTDVHSPVLLGKVVNPAHSWGGRAFVVNGPLAYISDGGDNIYIYDVSDPAAITQMGSVRMYLNFDAFLKYDHIFSVGGGIDIFDISSPLKPEHVREGGLGSVLIGKTHDYNINSKGKAVPMVGLPTIYRKETRFNLYATRITANAKYGYVCGNRLLRVLDLSKPWQIRQVSELNMSDGVYHGIAEGDYLYSARVIVDISNPAAPEQVKGKLSKGWGIAIREDILLSANRSSLDIWDVANPAKATLVKSIPVEMDLRKVETHNDIIYLGFYNGVVRSCRLGDDMALVDLDEINLAKTERVKLWDMAVEGDRLYLALGGDGVSCVDISDPENMSEYSYYGDWHWAQYLDAANGYAFVSDTQAGLLVIDMANKGAAKLVASYPGGLNWDITVSGNFIYWCTHSGIVVFASNLPTASY